MASLWCPADFGDHRDFWDSGSLWGPGFFFALDGIFIFFTGSFISIHIKNIGEMIFRHKMATTEPQFHFCAFVKKPIVLMFFL